MAEGGERNSAAEARVTVRTFHFVFRNRNVTERGLPCSHHLREEIAMELRRDDSDTTEIADWTLPESRVSAEGPPAIGSSVWEPAISTDYGCVDWYQYRLNQPRSMGR
jgi:hypothetical protein